MTKKDLDLRELANSICVELSGSDHNPAEVIGAGLDVLRDANAEATDVIKVLCLSLMMMTDAQENAASAGAIVAIKLLALLMPGRDMDEVANVALDMLKNTVHADEPKTVRIVVLRRERE